MVTSVCEGKRCKMLETTYTTVDKDMVPITMNIMHITEVCACKNNIHAAGIMRAANTEITNAKLDKHCR